MKTKRILKAGFDIYSNPFIEIDLPEHLIPPKEEQSSKEWDMFNKFKKDEDVDAQSLALADPAYADIYPWCANPW